MIWKRLSIGGLLLIFAIVGFRDAKAEPSCRATLAPSSLSLRDTGLDQNRVACGVDGMSLGSRVQATVDTPNFYGTLSAAFFAEYQVLHASGFEFSVGARIMDYRFAQSAVFTDAELAVGPLYLGVLRPRRTRWWGIRTVSSHALRFEVPLTNSSDESVTVSASPSYLVTMMPSSDLHAHARVAGLLWSVLPKSGPDARAALLASSDVAYAPVSSFAVIGGVEAQANWYGFGLDHLLARGGLRVQAGTEGALELSAAMALAGTERTDLVFWFGYRRLAAEKLATKHSRLQDWAHGSE